MKGWLARFRGADRVAALEQERQELERRLEEAEHYADAGWDAVTEEQFVKWSLRELLEEKVFPALKALEAEGVDAGLRAGFEAALAAALRGPAGLEEEDPLGLL